MSDGIKIEIDKAVLSRFNSLINEMQKTTGKEMKIVLRNAARDLCFAALRHTPLAAKYQSMELKKPKGDGNYLIITRHRYTGRRVIFAGTRNQAEKYSREGHRHIVRNRGFAKAGWLAAAAKLGVNVKRSYPAEDGQSTASEHAAAVLSDSGAIVKNMIPYIEDLDNGKNARHAPCHILEKSISDVSDRMEKSLERMARKAIRETFGV